MGERLGRVKRIDSVGCVRVWSVLGDVKADKMHGRVGVG